MSDKFLLAKLPRLRAVPPGWGLEKFGDVTRLACGQVSPIDEPYRAYIHVGPENIEAETGVLGHLETAETLGLTSGKYLFDEDAIVYSKIRPNLNKVCIPGFKGICSADAYPIWTTGRVNSRYLLHFMRSELFLRQAVAASMRTGLPKINRSDLSNIAVLVPPAREQKEIAAILDQWDSCTSSLPRVLDARRRMKNGLIQHLLSGKRRLAGSYGNWRTVKLGEVTRESKARNSDGLRSESVMAVTKANGMVPMREKTIASSLDRYKLVKRNWFAYNPMRINIGSIARWSGGDEVLVSPDYVVFSCREELLSPDYLDHFRYTHRWSHDVFVAGNGSVRVRIYYSDLARMRLPLPPIEEQRAISKLLNAADREIDLLARQLELFKKQKRGLMQKLLTGRIRVAA